MQTDDCNKKLIYRRWKHAHEEDQGNHMVFRPDSYEFAPSRGRVEFILEQTQACTFLDIASGDGLHGMTCELVWDSDTARISVTYDNGRQRTFEIVSLEADSWCLKKFTSLFL